MMFNTQTVFGAIILAGAGATCRFLLRTIETRWQIVFFWIAVLGYQLVFRPALGRGISGSSTLLDLVCVTVAIIAMKVAIEGKLTH